MRYNNDTFYPVHLPDVYGRRRSRTSWKKKHFAHSFLWLLHITDRTTLTLEILVLSRITVKKRSAIIIENKSLTVYKLKKKRTKQLRQINLCRLRCYECTEQILTHFWEFGFGSSGLSLEDKPSFHLISTYTLLYTHTQVCAWNLVLSIVIMFISRAQT